MPAWLRRGLAVSAIGVLALVSAVGAFAQDGSGSEVTIRSGDGEVGFAVNQFLPGDITVLTGTTVTWEFPWFEPHSVTFGSPTGDPSVPSHPGEDPVDFDGAEFVSSGLIFGVPEAPPVFAMTFNEPGEYSYFCILHPVMTGNVTVVDEGEVDEQADLDEAGQAEYDTALADLEALDATLEATEVTVTDNDDGTRTHGLIVSGLNDAGNDAMQFYPAALDITAGDTVTWLSQVGTPHTVTFNPQLLDPADIPPGPEGILEVAPTDVTGGFDGSGFVHSGTIGVVPDYNGGSSFSLRFNSAGEFDYICILHADQGMVGHVSVQEAATPTPEPTEEPTAAPTATPTAEPPAPPSTGTGTARQGDGIALTWLLIAGLAVIALGTGTASVRKLRRW